MPFCASLCLRFGNGLEEKLMKRKKVYVHSENRAEQLVKTAANKRNTYIYRFHGVETVGGRSREYIEEIELIPGEDGVTADDIKKLYAAEDSDVYYNLKTRRPQRTAEEKAHITKWKADYIRRFREAHGYEPNAADVNDAADEAFPKNWSASLDEILDGNGDDDSVAGDKSAVLAKAYRSSDSEPGAVEIMDEIASTWPESWQEIYERVLKNGETILPIFRLIAHRIENRKLASLRDELLLQLMSGELDVSEVSLRAKKS
ncbi:MAG: hypothetical protein NC093_11260 [Alistipes sp.]|nr:hypothetical protein [Alistipes sp.]